MKGRAFILAALMLIGAFAAVGSAPAAKKKARVSVVDYAFVAEKVKVRKGGRVIWSFDEGRHNVVGKGWKSPTKKDGTYKRRFKKVGKFKYRCTLHQPNMDGVVRVVKR